MSVGEKVACGLIMSVLGVYQGGIENFLAYGYIVELTRRGTPRPV